MREKLVKRLLHSRFVQDLSNDNRLKTIAIKVAAPAIISALAGTAISLVVTHIFAVPIVWMEVALFIAIMTFSSSGLFLALYVVKLISVMEAKDWYSIIISRPASNEFKISPYEDCIDAVRFAKFSVYVVGSHFTQEIVMDTGNHSQYLSEGIEHLLEGLVTSNSDEESRFVYKRIMQVDFPVDENIKRHQISRDAIVDETLCEHVCKVLQWRANRRIDVAIYARQFIPSFPSILIVDNEYVFFSLPFDRGQIKGGVGQSRFSYDFVLQLRDKTGKTANEFRALFDQLKHDATEIKYISNSG